MTKRIRYQMVHEDRLSELPNNILISIISRLTLKEATSTCILSTRWRHLHTYVSHLNFPKYRYGIDEKSNYMLHEDRISQLPRDILISIISQLTLQEATSTCILSTRWRHLHTYVRHLNFLYRDGIDTKSNYVGMIDQVLNSHRGGQIEELVVDMFTHKCDNFDRWFDFALSKKAEIICLRGCFHMKGPILSLPVTNGIKCLKDLHLGRIIEMTDQEFDLLVSNCCALECFRIGACPNLKNVSIVGHSKLKHVTLSSARYFESIVIGNATNLISLTLYHLGTGCAVELSNIPKLTKLNFRESFNLLMLAELLVKIPSCIRDQLQLLRLSTTFEFESQSYMSRMDLDDHKLLWVDLVSIKHLELVIETGDYLSCIGPFQRYVRRLIEACGSLEKLVIKFMHQIRKVMHAMCEECREVMGMDQPAAAAECSRCRLKFILGYLEQQPAGAKLPVKYLEITGYFGSSWQRKLALDVTNNAKALQKLTVVSCDQVALARARHDFRHIPFVYYDTGSSFSGWTELHNYEIENKWYSD